MAQANSQSTSAKGRFVVSLPDDTGKQLDAIAERLSKAVEEQTGVGIDLSRGDVIKSLAKSAAAVQSEQTAAKS